MVWIGKKPFHLNRIGHNNTKTEIFPKKIYVQNKAKIQTNKRMVKKKFLEKFFHSIIIPYRPSASKPARQIDRQTMDNIHSIVEYFLLLLLLMIIIIIINVMSIIHDLDRHHYDHHQAGWRSKKKKERFLLSLFSTKPNKQTKKPWYKWWMKWMDHHHKCQTKAKKKKKIKQEQQQMKWIPNTIFIFDI